MSPITLVSSAVRGATAATVAGQVALVREWLSTADTAMWPTPPEGGGRPAVLIPGLLAGDSSIARLGAWLRAGGFEVSGSGIALNVDCMAPLVDRVEACVERAVEEAGAPAVVIGQSRGGVIGRALAVRRPDLVEHLVTLGSPLAKPTAVHARTSATIAAMGVLGTLGVPGLFRASCLRGGCCEQARDEAAAPLPHDVRLTCVFSPSDAIVRWEACLDPAGENIEVATTHLGMGVDVRVWRHLATRL